MEIHLGNAGKVWRTRFCTALFLGYVAMGSAGAATGVTPASCLLKKPPAKAELRESHAASLLVYPAVVSGTYSGCQQVWFDSGELLMKIHFKRGHITKLELYEPDEEKVTCTYVELKVLSGPAKQCEVYLQSLQRQYEADQR